MAHTIDSISIKGMRKAHLRQLSEYIFWAGQSGDYYGNQIQFYKRHETLMVLAGFLRALADDKDLRIAK